VHPPQRARLRQLLEVAPDRVAGHAEPVRQLGGHEPAFVAQEVEQPARDGVDDLVEDAVSDAARAGELDQRRRQPGATPITSTSASYASPSSRRGTSRRMISSASSSGSAWRYGRSAVMAS
jgi:hypothetical protein